MNSKQELIELIESLIPNSKGEALLRSWLSNHSRKPFSSYLIQRLEGSPLTGVGRDISEASQRIDSLAGNKILSLTEVARVFTFKVKGLTSSIDEFMEEILANVCLESIEHLRREQATLGGVDIVNHHFRVTTTLSEKDLKRDLNIFLMEQIND